MATPNYGYEKRQRELAKKKKKEEKARAKASGKPMDDNNMDTPAGDGGEPEANPQPASPDGGSSS